MNATQQLRVIQPVVIIMSTERGSPRASYTARFKLHVVMYAVDHGNRAAGKHFKVDESCVRRWRSQREKLKLTPKDKRANRYRLPAYPELEKDLTDWLSEKRKSGVAVSINVIRLKALSIAQNTNIKDFKASVRWCNAFLERHGFSIRRRTTVAQKLPQDYEDKLISFQRFIIAKRKQHNYELRYIGNADQTPMTFDIVSNSTVDKKGSKTVSILTTGHEKDRFTVMLACLGDGTKLPPYVVFKRKTLPKKITFPNGVIVRCQEKGWMDEAMIKDWLKTVWSKVGGLRKTKSLLVWDSFRAHLSQATKRIVTSLNTETAVIPGGMTGMLQPLDVCINKPFKDRMRKKWHDWMLEGEHTLTPTGRTRKADLNIICKWIIESWNDIPSELVSKSFRKCCITNALDGTEDDDVWQEDDDCDPFNDEDGGDDLYYAEELDREAAEIDEDEYDRLFGESDNEEFDGF